MRAGRAPIDGHITETTAKRNTPTVAGVDVELVSWPAGREQREQARAAGWARLLLVSASAAPPITGDVYEDWIRLPASHEDVSARVRVLADRVAAAAAGRTPHLDENGVLEVAGRWVPLPPVEHRLVTSLLARYQAVVSRDVLARAGWPDGAPGRNVLDVHIVRLRRRLTPLGLVIRTVRSRGYLLEPAEGRALP